MASHIDFNEDEGSAAPISAINVTPFVDVVLVLLVIFMVMAPTMLKESLTIRLPKTATTDGSKHAPFALVVTQGGSVLLNGVLSGEMDVREKVKAALQQNPETQAVISADAAALHGDVVKVIDWLKSSGLNRFAVQIEKQSP